MLIIGDNKLKKLERIVKMEKRDKTLTVQNIINFRDWKNKDKLYLKELQNFFDLADNIEDENLRKNIIYQMLKCDRTLTNMIEEACKSIYKN